MLYSDATATAFGVIVNNRVAIDCGSSTAYGIYNSYSNYQKFINNSVSINTTSTSALAGRFYYSSTSYQNNDIYNNAFSNVTGAGYTMYVYSHDPAYNNHWDYNNLHNGASNIVQVGTPSATYSSLKTWITASGEDKHSISYDPGFIGLLDVRPDVNNPASWSLNGRALHIVTNNRDAAGNIRVEYRADGVPDIGAFEFTPDVIPPTATITPSTADPGDVQVITFGEQEVGRITWGLKGLTNPIEVRQYSGEKAPGIASAANPSGSMYFYTDIKSLGNGTSFDYTLDLNYGDIWLGNIANENSLKLAHQVINYPWMVYSNGLSATNTTTNVISASSLSRLGVFSGLENGSVPSAFVRTPSTVICIGKTALLDAEPKNGDYYKWFYNGTEITGAGGPNSTTYSATNPGSYYVQITFNNKQVESVPVTISTIAAPNALISANGPLTYCTGNGLTLDAGNLVPGLKYQWLLNGNMIPGATNYNYAVTAAGNYSVIVENIGCQSISAVSQVGAGPLNVQLGDDTTYCQQKDKFPVLDAGYPGARYRWSTGDTTQSIEVKQQGAYWVEVDGGTNCIDKDTIMVYIDPLPSASGISFVKNGNTYQFYPSGAQNATGFLWIFSDGSTSLADNPVKVITGDLYVRMVMFNGCGTDTVQLGWPLTVGTSEKNQTITVYPNPARDIVYIKGESTEITEIMVLNSVGAVVYKQATEKGRTTQSIDISGLPNGHYMLQAITSDGVINERFNIMR